MSMLDMLIAQVENSPMVIGNPNAQSMLAAIKSGDSQRGEQIANNLLKTYGLSKEDAIKQAKTFFHMS